MNKAAINFLIKSFLVANLLVGLPLPVQAQERVENWIQWRGPTADGDDSNDIVQARSDASHATFFCSKSASEQIERETRDISGWQVHIAKKLLETEADQTMPKSNRTR